jgi:conjugative relaxase-like TrwC/TraI family protein
MLNQLIVTSVAAGAPRPRSARRIALAKPPQFHIRNTVNLIGFIGNDANVHTNNNRREAVTTALTELERYTQARIGGNHAAETTGKFVAAKFEHDTARPVDGYAAPQLHTHAVIFNMTERADGSSRAVQPQSYFDSQQFATAVYQSELMYRLSQLGYEITPGRSGAAHRDGPGSATCWASSYWCQRPFAAPIA